MKDKLNKAIRGLKPTNDYQKFVLEVAIPCNLRDKCYSEVEFYLKDAFGVEL